MKNKINSKFRLNVILALTMMLFLSVNAYGAYIKAELVQETSGQVTDLYYSTLSQSYGDQGDRNPNVVLRLHSDNLALDLSHSFFPVVAYSDSSHTNFIVLQSIVKPMGYNGGTVDYEITGNYMDTDLDFSTSLALYPGKLYAIISKDDGIIESTDTFIEISPLDSWFVGTDGGAPCNSVSGSWIVTSDCSIESTADQTYDSFDLSLKEVDDMLDVTVEKAYWLSDAGNAVEIKREGKLVVEVKDKITGRYLDSGITLLGDVISLDTKDSSQVEVYVNGIKEGEIAVTPNEDSDSSEPSENTNSNAGSSGGSSSYSDVNVPELILSNKPKYEFTFPTIEDLDSYTVYLKEDDSVTLTITESDDIVSFGKDGIILNYYKVLTNIQKSNIDSSYLKFRIRRSVLTEKGIDYNSELFLYFMNGKDLTRLKPDILSQDADYIEFFISLDSISDFVIGNLEKKTEIQKSEYKEPLEKPVNENPLGKFDISIIGSYLLLILLLLGILFAVFRKKKRR